MYGMLLQQGVASGLFNGCLVASASSISDQSVHDEILIASGAPPYFFYGWSVVIAHQEFRVRSAAIRPKPRLNYSRLILLETYILECVVARSMQPHNKVGHSIDDFAQCFSVTNIMERITVMQQDLSYCRLEADLRLHTQ